MPGFGAVQIHQMNGIGAAGVIIGKAIYTGDVKLENVLGE